MIPVLHKSPTRITRFTTDLSKAVAIAQRLTPCVILVDHVLIGSPALADLNLQMLRGMEVWIVVMTPENDEERLMQLLRMGVAGFLHPAAETSLGRAIERIADGEIWASRRLISAALHEATCAGQSSKLTRRETEILQHIAAGHDNQWIADNLFITRDTVRWHLRSAYFKLGVHDRRRAATLMAVART